VSAKAWIGAMLVGTAIVVAVGARDDKPAPPPDKPREQAPWLSNEDAAQVVTADGEPGPLFVGAALGAPAPAEPIRQRIAEFARAHNLEIDLEVSDDVLQAIRVVVTYGGCCGYEAADVLARRLGRPVTGTTTVTADLWIDNWARVSSGIHMRANVHINRVTLRWQRAATYAEILERAESLIGADREVVAKAAGTGWHELESGRRYLLEVPYPYVPPGDWGTMPKWDQRDDLGMFVDANAGQITVVRLVLRPSWNDENVDWKKLLEGRWGKAKIREYDWFWKTSDHLVTADLGVGSSAVEVKITK
jgi:hypothetical protein